MVFAAKFYVHVNFERLFNAFFIGKITYIRTVSSFKLFHQLILFYAFIKEPLRENCTNVFPA